MEMHAICQCSDLYLKFDRRSDAKEFLFNFNNSNRFIYNYADFQFSLSSQHKNIPINFVYGNFSSELDLYAMKMLDSLGYVFTDKYSNNNNEIQSIFNSFYQKSPEKFYNLCYILWNHLRKDHCYSIQNVFDDPNIINNTLSKNKYHTPHAIITPLRVLFQPMHSTSGHRAMRQYNNKESYRWMLVYIRDEDESSKIMNLNQSIELRDRYKHILQNGIRSVFENLMYYYFGSSGSQMKKQEFWFMTFVNTNSTDVAASKVNTARLDLGNLKKIQNIATYIARVGLYLTTSKPTDVSIE
jgi:hypothetical protein